MIAQRWIRRLVVAALVGASTVAVTATSSPGAQVEAQTPPTLGAGGEFHSVTPSRVFDSRKAALDQTSPTGKKPTSSSVPGFEVQLAGKGGLPSDASQILAVVANVTVVEPTRAGWLGVQPTGATAGKSALVTFAPGRNVPNLAFVGVGTDGSMTVKLASEQPGQAHVVVDVFGWLSTSSAADRGSRLVTAGPGRLLDTRKTGGALGPGESRSLQIRGANSVSPAIRGVVPNDPSVTAVLVNIAAIAGTASTHISATPAAVAPGQPAATANINVVPGQIKTNMAVVPIGPDGKIHLRNQAGSINLAVDVFGYFRTNNDESRAGRIVPLDAPFRALDTRAANFGNIPLATGSVEPWSFDGFAGSVKGSGGEALGNQSALIGNLTGTGLGRVFPWASVSTHMTAYPGGASKPLVSNLNLTEGETVPNMSLLSYGSSGADNYIVQTYNALGSVHYVLDVYAVVLK